MERGLCRRAECWMSHALLDKNRFGFNLTAESIRYRQNVGIDMVLLNAFAYALEIVFLLLSLIIMTTYLVVSRLNRRFHSMLRILMNFMCFGMLVNSVFRTFMVPVRLFLGRDYGIPWVASVDNFCKTAQLATILQIDTTAFLISIERLIATMYIRRYEHMFSSLTHKIGLIVFLSIGLYGSSYYLFFARGDVYKESPQDTLMSIGYAMIATNLSGLLFLRITQVLSQRHLNGSDHALSKSYQCRENISVVRLISPICILLFFTRFCQFAFRIYVFYVEHGLGAFLVRLLAHMYNISLALSVFLTPTLLILLQPKLAAIFCKRSLRKLNYERHDARRSTAIYFDSLKKMWT
ncbi:hypothetical protein Aduo_010406 [Ancylostoma duodenale]